MIGKSILTALAIVATVGAVSPACAGFLETGTPADNGEGGFGNGYASTVPHDQQVLINHWPNHQRHQ